MKRIKKYRSIRLKLIFILTISAMSALFLSTTAIVINTYTSTKKEYISSLENIATILAQNLAASIEFDDVNSAKSLLKTLKVDENIEGAFIYKDDEFFSSYIKNKKSQEVLENKIKLVFSFYEIDEQIKYSDTEHIFVSVPISLEGENVATFCLIANTKGLNQIVIEQVIVQSAVSIAVLIISVLIALRLQRVFTSPIFELKSAMQKVERHHSYDLRIDNKYNDEFAVLFDGFNKMLKKIDKQNQDLERTKQKVEEAHKHTQESIEYASLIQSALIPENELFRKYFKDYFAIWRPKDVIGGDIYLFEELRDQNECLLMVIDCTGHGVPGAFVTMLVKAIERQITSRIKHSDEAVSPAKLLSIFNSSMKHLLKQENSGSISNAGFDGQIMYYNKKDKIVKIASARNEVFYYQEDELHIIKGDRHSVGYKDSNVKFEFKEHTIDVSKETTIYISSDGYWDQNGGEKNLPFGKRRFKALLNKIHKENMADQQEVLLDTHQDYKNSFEQNDDVTVVGIKI